MKNPEQAVAQNWRFPRAPQRAIENRFQKNSCRVTGNPEVILPSGLKSRIIGIFPDLGSQAGASYRKPRFLAAIGNRLSGMLPDGGCL